MKEKYTKPETRIDEYETVDVITTSAADVQDDDNDVPFGS